MKKLGIGLLIISILLLIISCKENRVLLTQLDVKSGIMYYEGKLYNGIGYEVYPNSNGQLKVDASIVDGKLNGTIKKWYKNGQLEYERKFNDGKLDGIQKQWYENGQLEYIENHSDEKKNGLQEYWYENGKKQGESNYKADEHDGMQKGWYDDGKLKHEDKYKNGKLDGIQRQWYKNGQLEYELIYKEGKFDGKQMQWHQNSQLESKSNYEDGNRDGLFVFYYENGQINMEANYKNDKHEGEQKGWHKNGQLKYETNSKNDQSDGNFKTWNESGQLEINGQWKNGEFIPIEEEIKPFTNSLAFDKNKNKSIDIDINEAGIFINSVKINLPSSLNKIKTILGEPTNEIIQSQTEIVETKKKFGAVPNNIYKYDNYGILIYQPADQEEIKSISIYFERPINNLKLLNAFTGKLQLYGVDVNRNTSFNDLKTISEIEISESNFRVCLATSSAYELTFEFQNDQSKNRLNGFSIEKKKSSEETNEKGWTEGDIEIFKAAISGLEEIKMLCSQYELNISDFADCYTSRVVTAITIYEMQNPTSKTQAIFAEIMQDCIQQSTKR